jgi:hypothetical protein
MPYYLAPYVGSGTRNDPFRPVGSDQPGWSAIDLRADKGVTVDGGGWGFALLYLPPGIPTPARAIKLADDLQETVALTTRQFFTLRLPLDFSKDQTIQDVCSTLLLAPPQGWWNPLQPSKGRLEAWIGSDQGKIAIVQQPVIAGGTLSDNFNRANESPLAAPWQQMTGSATHLNLVSNAVSSPGPAGTTTYAYQAPSGWTADQSSEWLYASAITSNDWAPAVRCDHGLTAYTYEQFLDSRGIVKIISGSFTLIESVSGNASVGGSYKLAVSGSTLRYYDNGSEHVDSPATDTSITGAGVGAGVVYYQAGGSLDNWIGTGEVVAGGSLPPPPLRPIHAALVR